VIPTRFFPNSVASMPGVVAGSVITFGLCASAYVIPALLGGL